MSTKFFFIFCGLALLVTVAQAAQNWHALHVQPEQLHLALGSNTNEMVVTWTTFNETKQSTCKYGLGDALNLVAHGAHHKFTDGGHLKRFMFIHRVYLTNLTAASRYAYHCGSADGWSPLYHFKTLPSGESWSPKFVVYGDLGNINGRTLGRLAEEVQRGDHDVLLHVGDMAYDLHTDNALVGDEFMRQIEPIAAYLPYQTCPGNHEHTYNFSNYRHRFSMHSQGHHEVNNIFWSYNIGPVHLVAFSTELHYFTQFGHEQIMTQYNFLKKDLEEANKPENRAKHPWIITIGHRPMYVQTHVVDLLRTGNHTHHWPGFEQLFYDAGVDLQFYGHEHNYERILPIYNNKIHSGTTDPHNPYHNPKAPVHITTGSAGNRELHTKIHAKRSHYSAFIIEDYGFTYMKVINHSHVHIQQLSEDKGGKVVDEFYLIKDKHGVEAWK